MFERTFSFWRRWVGHPQNEGATATATLDRDARDRRLWVRFPADFEASMQPADQAQGGKAAAQIRDISRGGANLLLDHEVEPGQLVSLELPHTTADGACSILACVVRAMEEADGRWALGCVFARELTADDLRGFGAERVRHQNGDQRTWQRFDGQLTAEFEKIGAAQARRATAQVLNLSASGVGLLVQSCFDAGALLNLVLIGNDGRQRRTILACVVHVDRRAESLWALGCNFIRELNDNELQALI